MEDLLQNDLFHLVFGILAAIFLLGALVNAISIIKNNGNTGNEHAPVRLENPFAAQKPAAAAPTPVPASATVAADNPAGQPVKAPADDDEEYVWR